MRWARTKALGILVGLEVALLMSGADDLRHSGNEHRHAVKRSCSSDNSPTTTSQSDRLTRNEHSAALKLVAFCSASHIAVQSGYWSNPATWALEDIPAVDSRVHIPEGVSVTVGGAITAPIDWIRSERRFVGTTDG